MSVVRKKTKKVTWKTNNQFRTKSTIVRKKSNRKFVNFTKKDDVESTTIPSSVNATKAKQILTELYNSSLISRNKKDGNTDLRVKISKTQMILASEDIELEILHTSDENSQVKSFYDVDFTKPTTDIVELSAFNHKNNVCSSHILKKNTILFMTNPTRIYYVTKHAPIILLCMYQVIIDKKTYLVPESVIETLLIEKKIQLC